METVASWRAIVLSIAKTSLWGLCVRVCIPILSSATLSAPSQNDLFVISAPPFTESCTEAFLMRRDRVCLGGNESVPPKQYAETVRCSS